MLAVLLVSFWSSYEIVLINLTFSHKDLSHNFNFVHTLHKNTFPTCGACPWNDLFAIHGQGFYLCSFDCYKKMFYCIFNHTSCLQSWIFLFNTLPSPLICGSQGKENMNNLSMASNGFSTPSQLGNYTCKCNEYIQFNVKRHDVLWNFVEWEVTWTSIHLFRLHILCS
jgi:hypothetical protein